MRRRRRRCTIGGSKEEPNKRCECLRATQSHSLREQSKQPMSSSSPLQCCAIAIARSSHLKGSAEKQLKERLLRAGNCAKWLNECAPDAKGAQTNANGIVVDVERVRRRLWLSMHSHTECTVAIDLLDSATEPRRSDLIRRADEIRSDRIRSDEIRCDPIGSEQSFSLLVSVVSVGSNQNRANVLAV